MHVAFGKIAAAGVERETPGRRNQVFEGEEIIGLFRLEETMLGQRHHDAAGEVLVALHRIRHHLGRARVAALDGAVRAQTQIAQRLQDLGDVLGTIHSDRSITFSMDVPADQAVACEPQDFDEMAGNLLDNAFMWTRTSVRVDVSREGAMVHILVDDDGPGLALSQREQALRPGERLDEAAPGFGFGLSIVSELAELYGGSITLGEAPLGGLRAILALPARPPI
jgi:signal transduction histidine kinase